MHFKFTASHSVFGDIFLRWLCAMYLKIRPTKSATNKPAFSSTQASCYFLYISAYVCVLRKRRKTPCSSKLGSGRFVMKSGSAPDNGWLRLMFRFGLWYHIHTHTQLGRCYCYTSTPLSLPVGRARWRVWCHILRHLCYPGSRQLDGEHITALWIIAAIGIVVLCYLEIELYYTFEAVIGNDKLPMSFACL